jgi:hypothetical protein
LRFFETFQALFSRSRAFQLYIDNHKRRLIKGLSFLPENIRQEAELVYMDIFPDTTRYPEKWEDVFGVLFTEDELEKRRDIINSLWKINRGGQGIDFLEDILQKIENTIHVYENIPLRNPRDSNIAYPSCCDNRIMVCDNDKARCDYRIGDENFIPTLLMNNLSELYNFPNDPAFWETCFFVCKSVTRNSSNKILFIERLQIPLKWKNYIEYLILRIKPVHTTAVLFVEWL